MFNSIMVVSCWVNLLFEIFTKRISLKKLRINNINEYHKLSTHMIYVRCRESCVVASQL